MVLIYVLAGLAVLAAAVYFGIIRLKTAPPHKRENDRTLELSPSGGLRILQMTDLHLVFPIIDTRTLWLAERMVKSTQPDLVAVSGDLLMSPLNFWRLHSFIGLMKKLGVKVALCCGNHDANLGVREGRLARQLMSYDNVFFADALGDGSGCFCIQVKSGNKAKYNIYFVNSGTYGYFSRGKNRKADFITAEMTQWLCKVQNREPGVPFIVFCHIPPQEMSEAKRLTGHCGCTPYRSVGNGGFMDSIAELPGALGVFFGHDHKNDFESEYRGVGMYYGRAGGFTAHGMKGMDRGARVIELKDGKISTHIVIESEL